LAKAEPINFIVRVLGRYIVFYLQITRLTNKKTVINSNKH